MSYNFIKRNEKNNKVDNKAIPVAHTSIHKEDSGEKHPRIRNRCNSRLETSVADDSLYDSPTKA